MTNQNTKTEQRARRHARIRAVIKGTAERPRLSVFRSNKFLYAELIDDTVGKTLAAADSRKVKAKSARIAAKETGALLAKHAVAKGVKRVVFDRGGYVYAGKVKELADGAREGGLEF